MHGTILENVVIQFPANITLAQVKEILKQTQEEYKVLKLTLGGIDLEMEETTLIIRTWVRSPYKHTRKIENFPTILEVESIENNLSTNDIVMESISDDNSISKNCSSVNNNNVFQTLWNKVKL